MFEFSNLEFAYFSAFLCKICVTAECKVGRLSIFVWYSDPGGAPTPTAHPGYAC